MLVLRNCKFIKDLTEGTELSTGDLLIENDKISAILPCGTIIERAHEEYDLNGATVLPGLINAHVHLFMIKDPDYFMEYDSIPKRTLDCLKFSQFLLKNGYTTIRDCGDDSACPTVALRDKIRTGELTGPNILTSGATLCPTEIGCDPFLWMTTFVDSPMEVRKEARNNFAKGIDFLKLYGTGSMLAVESVPGRRIMAEDEIRAGVEIAELKGSYAAIHAHGAEAIEVAVKSGVSTIEHATFINEAALEMLDGRMDVGIVPTVSLVNDFLAENPISESHQALIDNMTASLKNAYSHNVLIGWGTDICMEKQQKEVGLEFRLRKELLGYSNIDLLKQATINSAKLIRMEDKIGTIRPGKLADLVVIDGDPVSDISLMYTAPLHVIKSGVFIK